MKMLPFIFVAMLACAGCDNKPKDAAPESKPEKAAEAPKEAPKAETVPAVAAADPDDGIPTQDDFDDQSEKEITKDTVDSEVDKLAKEVGE